MDTVEFLTLDRESFTYGVAQPVVALVRRVIAENPSKFTYFGTGTYIVGGDGNGRGDVVVIDPGPRLDAHRDALAAALDFAKVSELLPPMPQKPFGEELKMTLSNQTLSRQTLSQDAEAQVADLISSALQPRRGKA